MAVAEAVMLRPVGGPPEPPYYSHAQMTNESVRTKKLWSSKPKTSRKSKSPENFHHDGPYFYGTISAPGGSALSKSMKYAETWLYGTVRANPSSSMRPSIFKAYHEMSPPLGPVLISTPQKAPPNYAVIICSCTEYLNGTKKTSSTKVSICKKCKGSRLPITVTDPSRVLFGGTLRAPNLPREPISRSGTVKLTNTKSRPSILKSIDSDSNDPYDLMRRSRLAVPQEAKIGSQFSTARSRAKSISPPRGFLRHLSPPPDIKKCRSKSVSRPVDPWLDNQNDATPNKNYQRSILSCDVNPYQLISYERSTFYTSKNIMDNSFDSSVKNDTKHINQRNSAYDNVKAIGGQRIRVSDNSLKVDSISTYDKVDFDSDLRKFDLKTEELSPCLSTKSEKLKKKTPVREKPKHQKSSSFNTTLNKPKTKLSSPKRPPRRLRSLSKEEDSESDHQRNTKQHSNDGKILYKNKKNQKLTQINNHKNIKSILKKPRESRDEQNNSNFMSHNSSSDDKNLLSSQFYVPTPLSNISSISNRKRVQFLVENDDTKIIYTAEFDFFENTVYENKNDASIFQEKIEEKLGMLSMTNATPDIVIEEVNDLNQQTVNHIHSSTSGSICNDSKSGPKNADDSSCKENDIPKFTVLRRSESDRISTQPTVTPPKFLDTMALRNKTKKTHTSQVFLNRNIEENCEIKMEKLVSNYEINLVQIEENVEIEKEEQSKLGDNDNGNWSDVSDVTEQVLKNLRPCLTSPDPPPRQKQNKATRNRKNNYVKTRFIRTDNSSSDEWSDNSATEQKTVLKIPQPEFDIVDTSFQSENIDESYESLNIESRRTSILINGNDCYSTMNISDDAPLYLSSVVVNDEVNQNTSDKVTTVTISVNSTIQDLKCELDLTHDSYGYDGDNEKEPHDNVDQCYEKIENIPLNTHDVSDLNIPNDEKTGFESHIIGCDSEDNDNSTCFVSKLLNDPLLGHLAEGLDSELINKLIESSLMRLQEQRTNANDDEMNKEYINKLIENSFDSINAAENVKNSKHEQTDKITHKENELNDCSAPYEGMEYESGLAGINSDLDPMSDCYNASTSELSTEDDTNSTRSKFYQMLVDSSLCEISNADDDHLYESIRLNNDPIYEEIGDMPPPLPLNPPPISMSSDDEKKSNSRSIFEGASKYDILSYLVDAKERGIVNEETYISNYGSNSENISQVDDKERKVNGSHGRQLSDLGSGTTNSDSGEDNSLVICTEGTEKNDICKKTSAEIERNDSGVGSETSKSSRSRWQGRRSPDGNVSEKLSTIHLCEDCDSAVEMQHTETGVVFAPLVCRKCAKKRAERKEIITEIVETEEKYGRDLQIILEEFYKPMLVAGLLSHEQLSAIFLNVEELLDNNQTISEKMRDALEIALEQGDEDLLTVNIGKIMLECSHMLSAFQTYCVRQAGAALLLSGLEKEKELLRIFLRVSQMENAVLRRMNLNSFLMVPVQRVTKYPLLLSRLFRATPPCASERDEIMTAQRGVEARLEEMNAAAAAAAREVPLWRRLAAAKRTAHDLHVADIKLRKMAVDVLEWNHDDARFAMEGKLLFTQPNDNNWRKGRTIKLTAISALLVTNGKPTSTYKPLESASSEHPQFPKATGVREAALLLVREKAGRYTLLREPLYLDRCVIAADQQPDQFFEVHEITTKDSFIFKAEESNRTLSWYKALQYHAQGAGAWRKRRNALANIMINGMLTRN